MSSFGLAKCTGFSSGLPSACALAKVAPNVMAGTKSTVSRHDHLPADCDSEAGLAHFGRAQQQHGLAVRDEASGGKVTHLPLVDRGLSLKVETGEVPSRRLSPGFFRRSFVYTDRPQKFQQHGCVRCIALRRRVGQRVGRDAFEVRPFHDPRPTRRSQLMAPDSRPAWLTRHSEPVTGMQTLADRNPSLRSQCLKHHVRVPGVPPKTLCHPFVEPVERLRPTGCRLKLRCQRSALTVSCAAEQFADPEPAPCRLPCD